MSDFFSQVGSLGLGSRLRRLSDRLMADGARIYESVDVNFKPSWFPLFAHLTDNPSVSIQEAADALGVSHVAVLQSVKELEEARLISTEKSTKDARVRLLRLSPEGVDLHRKVQTVWGSIHEAIRSAEQDAGVSMVRSVESLEKALDSKSFFERFRQTWTSLKIVPFEAKFAADFYEISYEWISHTFEVEPIDLEFMRDPQGTILDHGGAIFMAVERESGKAVGTCALLQHGGEWELAKLGVRSNERGRGAGCALCEVVIEEARRRGIKRLVLETNHQLTPAITLYEKLGFRHEPNPKTSDYARSDTYMVRDL